MYIITILDEVQNLEYVSTFSINAAKWKYTYKRTHSRRNKKDLFLDTCLFMEKLCKEKKVSDVKQCQELFRICNHILQMERRRDD